MQDNTNTQYAQTTSGRRQFMTWTTRPLWPAAVEWANVIQEIFIFFSSQTDVSKFRSPLFWPTKTMLM
jgi:hypothetical protein